MGASMDCVPETLERDVGTAMLAEQPALRRRLRALGRLREGAERARKLERLAADAHRSAERRRARRMRMPAPAFPAELPVAAHREAIAAAIAEHPVTIVCGDTGSGKTTQLPKILLALGYGAGGYVGHTQPRRIAARAAAARIAAELDSEPGRLVGHKVRFEECVARDALVKVMTDGLLLAELAGDRWLRHYEALIIDEAHERNLNVDFLLGCLRRILPVRPELKVVITSATIDPERFSRHFGGAPIIEVSGRAHPVEVDYRPPAADAAGEVDLHAAVVEAVAGLAGGPRGDILVFLPGERDIREVARALRRRPLGELDILPLYGRLGSREQDRVFASSKRQRVVLATNVAETSLTVPNIDYVVDSGLARIARYSYRSKIERLPVEPIARASAEQRKGRAGRTGPGLCLRLYAREDLEARPLYTEPEIQRTNLAGVVLRMKALGLGDIERFPFLDPPDTRFVRDGLRLLRELDALDAGERLTAVGRRLARLPVDPRVGRMILAAGEEGSLDEVLIIAAALSIQDPFARPADGEAGGEPGQARFRDPRSDFLAYLNAWRFYHEHARGLSSAGRRRLSEAHGIAYPRLCEWQAARDQLHEVAREVGVRRARAPAGYAAIHRALLAGLLGSVGLRDRGRDYRGPRGTSFRLSPGSALSASPPPWIVAAELVETRRVYAHRAARIQPQWIERIAPAHLLRKSHGAPEYDAARGRVLARERVSLYGLPVASGRRVPYERIDRAAARALFIDEGLAAGRVKTRGEFLAHNRALVESLRVLEHKARRTDLVAGEEAVARFYDARLPDTVTDAAGFERWRAAAERETPGLLHLDPSDLLRPEAAEVTAEDYPDSIRVAGHELPLRYRFAPGEEDDGVTVTVPAALLGQLPEGPFEWLVPGFRPEKVQALLRALPKRLRRELLPLPATVAACLERLEPGEGPLLEALSEALADVCGRRIEPDAWPPARLPPHLLMRFEIVDASLEPIARGRDLGALRRRHAGEAVAAFEALRSFDFDREGLTRWDFGELPETVEFHRGRLRLRGYPALVDEGRSVALRLRDGAAAAAEATRAGMRRLFLLRYGRDVKALKRALPGLDALALPYALVEAEPPAARRHAREPLRSPLAPGRSRAGPVPGVVAPGSAADDLLEAAIAEAFLGRAVAVRTQDAFERALEEGFADLGPLASRLLETLRDVLGRHHGLRRARRRLPDAPALAASLADVDSQLRHLVYRGFLLEVPAARLAHYPRYLEALSRRLGKLARTPAKEGRRSPPLSALWQRYLALAAAAPLAATPELDVVRWQIEELRVTTFAQALGTQGAVSAARVEAALAALEGAAARRAS